MHDWDNALTVLLKIVHFQNWIYLKLHLEGTRRCGVILKVKEYYSCGDQKLPC